MAVATQQRAAANVVPGKVWAFHHRLQSCWASCCRLWWWRRWWWAALLLVLLLLLLFLLLCNATRPAGARLWLGSYCSLMACLPLFPASHNCTLPVTCTDLLRLQCGHALHPLLHE
jgi:hypothetical protein